MSFGNARWCISGAFFFSPGVFFPSIEIHLSRVVQTLPRHLAVYATSSGLAHDNTPISSRGENLIYFLTFVLPIPPWTELYKIGKFSDATNAMTLST
jgi:hypothetical protein